MPDYLFLYYLDRPDCLALWVEVKRPGDRDSCRCKPAENKTCRVCRQAKWRATEERRGATVVQTSSLESFAKWYESKLGGWLHGPDGPRKNTQIAMGLGE
jgi:hypothetical protein